MFLTKSKVTVKISFQVLAGISSELKEIMGKIKDIYMANTDNPIIAEYYNNFLIQYNSIQIGCKIPEKYYIQFNKSSNASLRIEDYLQSKHFDFMPNIVNANDLIAKYTQLIKKDYETLNAINTCAKKPTNEDLKKLYTDLLYNYKDEFTKLAEEEYNDGSDEFVNTLIEDDLKAGKFNEDEIHNILIPITAAKPEHRKYIPNDDVLLIKFISFYLSNKNHYSYDELTNLFNSNGLNIDSGTIQIIADYIAAA